MLFHFEFIDTVPVFCPGYLEWWLDSTLHLVLFIQYILNSVSVVYIYMYNCTCICISWEVVNSVVIPDQCNQCGQNTTQCIGDQIARTIDNTESFVQSCNAQYNYVESSISMFWIVQWTPFVLLVAFTVSAVS